MDVWIFCYVFACVYLFVSYNELNIFIFIIVYLYLNNSRKQDCHRESVVKKLISIYGSISIYSILLLYYRLLILICCIK